MCMRSPKSRVLNKEQTTTNVSNMARSTIIPLSHIPSCILTDTLLYTCDIIQMEYKEDEFGVTQQYVNKPGIKSVNYIYNSPTNDSMETQNQAETNVIEDKTVQEIAGDDTVVQYPTEKVESIARKVEYRGEKIEYPGEETEYPGEETEYPGDKLESYTYYRETPTTKQLEKDQFRSPRRYRIYANVIIWLVVCYTFYANS